VRGPAALLAATAALVLAGLAAVVLGSGGLTAGRVAHALLAGPDPTHLDGARVVVWDLRLPRVCLGALVGGGLALAGAALQGLLRNPLADPYVLGVSSGASLGASLGLLWLGAGVLGGGAVPALAVLGAALATLVVFRLAWVDGALPLTGVLLAGVAVSLTISAAVSLVVVAAEERAGDIVFWLLGNLGGRGWSEVAWVGGAVTVAGGGLLALARPLDALVQGEEVAASLGVRVERAKLWLLALTALLVGAAVSFCGVIGFVGLVVPHAARGVVGPGHRWLLPVCAAGGAALLVAADVGARLALPGRELPVGVVTALLGGPVFLLLLRRGLRHVAR
jgi:iron complex transport system permease protein